MRICVSVYFLKKSQPYAHRPLAPLTHTKWKRDSGPTQRRCLLLLPPPASSIDVIASPLPSPPPSPRCHRRAASSLIAAIATALVAPPLPRGGSLAMAACRFHRHRRHQGWSAAVSCLYMTVMLYVVIQAHSCLWRSILSLQSDAEYPPNRPHTKINFCVQSVSIFQPTARIFATARKN